MDSKIEGHVNNHWNRMKKKEAFENRTPCHMVPHSTHGENILRRIGEGYIICKMTVSHWAQLRWDRRICGWFVIRRLGPTSTPKCSPIGAILGLQFLLFPHFLTFSLQSGGYIVIQKNFYKRCEKFDPIVASAIDQRNFCKKPQVKSSFRSEEDRSRSYRQTDRQILLFIIWTRADARRPIAIYAQYMII